MPLDIVLIWGSPIHCSYNLPTQPIILLDSSQQSYDANKKPSSTTEKEEEIHKYRKQNVLTDYRPGCA
jgi:hypothetical protein